MPATADVDQQAASQALHAQGARCLELLDLIGTANARILARARAGDAIWSRVEAGRFNQACRDRSSGVGDPDPYLTAIRSDPDLAVVCDNRWLLGEAVDALASRLARLDTISAPYDDFERCIRQAVTGPDRSASELADGVAAAQALGRRASAWRLTPRDDATLVDRWMRRLKNNPVVAAVVVAATVLTGTAGVYKLLPSALTQPVAQLAVPAARTREGWAVAGTLDPADAHRWSRANVDVVEPSGGSARPYPVRAGDIVEPRVALPIWIVDYRHPNAAKPPTTPPGLAEYLAPDGTRTRTSFAAGARLEVQDVSLMPIPGKDDVLWLRLTPR